MNSLRLILRNIILTAFLGVMGIGGVTAAYATFAEPGSTFPNGNVDAPVDLGSLTQTKNGNFSANQIGVTNGFCIGAACITSWPVAPLVDISSCQMCFHVASDDSGVGQCGSNTGGIAWGGGSTCVSIDQWTTAYRDDTDNRRGGCQMQWMLKCSGAPATPAVAAAPTSGDGGISSDWSNVYSGSYTNIYGGGK